MPVRSVRHAKTLAVVLAWLIALAMVCALWQHFTSADAFARAPAWFLNLSERLGSVVYADPQLALRIRLSRLAVLITAAALLAVGIIERRWVGTALRELFLTKTHPLNLAIFRMVVGWQVYEVGRWPFGDIAAFPTALQYPPETGIPRWGALAAFAHWPPHTAPPWVIAWCVKIMIYAGFAGMAGLFSRTSMALAGVMMLFGMGRLQWYGKVDHYHHVLWFTLLLAASPCGDALSIDALRAAWKRARNGQTEPPGPAQRYQVPLAFAMLLIALIYLFPGLWKICRSGLDWALSDSPKYLMYQVWFSIGGFLPKLRYDQHPLLYKAGALAGLLFELSFVFLVLDKRLRYVGAALGVLFHTLTEITLTISFDSLRACYVVFVNWHALLQKLAAFLFPKKRIVSYDPSDLPRVRWIALLRTFDVFGRIDWRPVHGRASATPARTVSPSGKPLFVLGSFMLAAVIWTGAFRMMDGWPFACYPPFDGIADATYRTMTITLLEEDGSTRVLLPDDYRRLFGNRWNTLMQRILDDHDPAIQNQHLKLIFSILAAREPLLQHARLVQFGTVSSSVEPSRWNVPPGNYQLVLQVPLHDLLARPAS